MQTAERGASLDVIAESFAASKEFTNRYGSTTDEQFLAIVYRNVLGRDYDQGGFQYWLDKLRTELSRGGTVRTATANTTASGASPTVESSGSKSGRRSIDHRYHSRP